jgi:hypothetical protein
MATLVKYRRREANAEDIEFVRNMITQNPKASRRKLSLMLCEAWDWRQQNGQLCDVLCRGLLLAMHRGGFIELPAPRMKFVQPGRRLVRDKVVVAKEPIEMSLSRLGPIDIEQVRRTPQESVVKSLVSEHHFLGYVHPVGEHLKYLVTARERPIACFCWSSAPRHLGPRDRHIGWSKDQRTAHIRFVAYQTRFLIVPWVRVPHLASYLLGRVCRRLAADWEHLYAHPVYFCETFVDPTRNKGTSYRAANWIDMGLTTGRGKDDQTNKPNRSRKIVFGYPLRKDYRALLCSPAVGS